MIKDKPAGLQRIIKATGYSMAGLKAAWKNEAALRQEIFLLLILLPSALVLGRNGMERAVLIAVCLFVIITELLNSAVEAVVDRIGPEQHPLAGRAKDLGSAAVFISLITVVLVWAFIAYDRFTQ